MRGKFILVVGASGSGKGTLINHIRPLFPDLIFPKSCTTRAMRPGEVNGAHYYFLDPSDFQDHIDAGDFLEWAEYGGNRYGTLRSEVEPLLESGGVGLKELEVQGARQILEKLPKENIVIVFVDAGEWSAVEQRIRERAPITDDEVLKRKGRYDDEMTFMDQADYVINNHDGNLETAKSDFADTIRGVIENNV